jgi:3-deoxy-D-manno-octulosonic-acid transferase
LLTENGALRRVHDAASLGATVVELLGDTAARRQMAEAAHATLESNRGALDAALAMIRACLAGPAA